MVNRTMARPSLVRAVVLEKARGRYRRQILCYMTGGYGKVQKFPDPYKFLRILPYTLF